ncbi:MAG TPA: trypsin-like peptidase domain-containing protein [Terriglobales bacterium]|nr:trypsin-like peptidase domain-containing protein [Terriglobales bacterium]
MASALIDFSNELAEAVEQAGKSVVVIPEGGQSGVSGTVWRQGIVVTAEHTIRGRQEVSVVLSRGETAKAAVAGRDSTTDLAVLKVAGGNIAPARLADPAQLRVGHLALAIGRRSDEGLCASYGVVSAIGGEWRTWQGGRIDRFLRLDLLPFTGFSGGPVVDVQGQVLGINTSGPRRSVLTIPRTTVDRVVTQLLEKGHIARGYLGAGLQPVQLPATIRKGAAEKYDRGLLIVTVAPDGPAEKAGLLLGDILLALEGKSVSEPGDVQAALDSESVGKTLSALLLRGGKAVESNITIGERPRRA